MIGGVGLGPTANAIVGGGTGMRSPAIVQVAPADQGSQISTDGSSITFGTGARAESALVVSQQMSPALTPLNALGNNVDVQA
ncbi:MAG: hypothetical protein FJ033_10615 [Chloroflexi bacterium]|nr:hypothetical protein [Chloroflexota bacterium]